jgi:glycosyltransferase involved in cell wall biosynthesis
MFEFLKYIQPGNYYRLIDKMPAALLMQSEVTVSDIKPYLNSNAFLMDTAYRKLQEGYIPDLDSPRNALQDIQIKNVLDNYVFIRRYFSVFQLCYVLIIRLFSLNNPIYEIYGFFRSLLLAKRALIKPCEYPNWDNFNSELVESKPLVSVIIPTLNRYEYLKDVLRDLEKQTYTNFEVIVVDQSEPFNRGFYNDYKFTIIANHQKEKALWLARNKAIKQSKGEYILLFDDDSRVESDWIANHIKCLDFFSVNISAGVTHTLVGGGLGEKEGYFHLSDVFDTGNALLHRSVFEKVGLFDRQFEKQRMGDSEFGLRALLGGEKIISNPYASRVHLKVETGGLRQMGSWDALRPKSLLAPRPVPSVLYLLRKYYGQSEAIFYLIKNIPQSYMPYKLKNHKVAKALYLLFFPVFIPMALFAVRRSWKLSSSKINQGSLIEKLV